MNNRTIRIGVVDDHPLLMDGILNALRQQADFDVVGTGHTMAEAISLAVTHKPEVMLLDIGIRGGGIEAAHHIAKHEPGTKLIMFTASDRPDHVNASLAAGVMGYVLKGANSGELCESIRAVGEGRRYITPELAMTILAPRNTLPEPLERGEEMAVKLTKKDFTNRELDVIRLLSAGKTNKIIADELSLSEKTVKNHMSNIMDKLQVHSRLSAALIISKWDKAETE
jgi:two-component system, NarL family, nitrate/nitrite response regulator NarL